MIISHVRLFMVISHVTIIVDSALCFNTIFFCFGGGGGEGDNDIYTQKGFFQKW